MSILVIVSGFYLNDADAVFSPTTPVIVTDKVPSITDFKNKSEKELLQDFSPFTFNRENNEQIRTYYFYDKQKSVPVIIGYIEDSTDVKLPEYYIQNNDYIEWYLALDEKNIFYVYAERDGNSCLFPFDKYNEFKSGTYTGCDGGAVEVKQLNNGFALYAKFFKQFDPPTIKEPYSFYYNYIDYQSLDKDKLLDDYDVTYYPDYYSYGQAIPLTDKTSSPPVATSGVYNQNAFSSLFFNNEYITVNQILPDYQYTKFKCADNTVSIKSDKTNYEIDDVANFEISVDTHSNENKIRLKIFNSLENEIFKTQKELSTEKNQKFMVVLSQFGFKSNELYRVDAELGTDGPKSSTYFVIGNAELRKIEPELCQIYTLYDKGSKSATFLVHIDDPSNSGYDQVQIHVDKNGDSNSMLDKNDFSYSLSTDRFGVLEFKNNGGWVTKPNFYDQGRMVKNNLGYNVFLKVDNVSENFKFAIEQIDQTGYDLKTTRYPENGFSMYPGKWSIPNNSGETLIKNSAEKYMDNDIVQKIPYTINLITIGEAFEEDLKKSIKQKLESKYLPIISSSSQRSGIEYSYNYNFVDISESESKTVADFIKSESKSWKGIFPGENAPFDDSWGLGPWIQMNHTEWVKSDRYDIKYKIMDASKMEEFLNDNFIKNNPEFLKKNSSNLIFINLDMNDIDFLRTYGLHTKDNVTDKYHDAVGLMGFGGKYNLYFFDLYSVPWDDFQGLWSMFYDKEWNNHKINFHDIHDTHRKAQLISDYVNNSTSKIITPSILYPSDYYPKVNLDFFVVSVDSDIDIPQLKKYFVDESEIVKDLTEFMPLTEWNVNITVSDVNDREFPKDLKKVFDDRKTFPIYENYPDWGTYDVIDSEKLSKVVVSWVESKNENNNVKNIPVVLFVVGGDSNNVYIDGGGTVGLAPPDPDNPNISCCAYGVTTDYNVWTLNVSPNKLLVHELGHVLGLMHPFMGYDNEGNFGNYDYFEKYTSSVMAYNMPDHGCALWYDYLVEDMETCGNADPTFTEFEKNNYYQQLTIQLQKQAKSKIHQTVFFERLDSNQITNSIQNIEKLISESSTKLKNGQYLGDDGSIMLAVKARDLSQNISEKLSEKLSEPTAIISKAKVPGWVKNNAKWWSDGQVDDSTFTQGIGFLIKEKIISISSMPPQSAVSEEKIPDWIKNNAKWWSEGLISEDDFLKGITYMVEKGIIGIQ